MQIYRRLETDCCSNPLGKAVRFSSKRGLQPPYSSYSISIEIPETGFVGNAIQSAQLKLEQRLTEDTNIWIIGVHAMGGVSKTSLLQIINNILQVHNSFDPIIWVMVSRDYEIFKLQDLDCIYKMTTNAADYTHPTADGTLSWRCDSSCISDSDAGL